jgi:hypothetical protein
MGRALTISDALYDRLETIARSHGLETIEQLLEYWQASDERLRRRDADVQRIDALRERLAEIHGQMPDSTDLIREDRAR